MIKRVIKRTLRMVFMASVVIFLLNNVAGPLYSDYIATSNIDIKDLSNFTQPLKNSIGDNYCSSSTVDYKGQIFTVTNNHCCNHGLGMFGEGEVRVGDFIEKVIHQSILHDVCILTSKYIASPIKLADKGVEVLDKVLVMGYPRGGFLTPRWGHVIHLNREVCISDGIDEACAPSNFLSTITYGGNSGSPIFNDKGELVNIIYAGNTFIHTYGISVPYVFIKDALNEAYSKVN